MLEKKHKVLVSISGGPDSVFLLHSLTALSQELGVNITAFHLNHMTRGGQSKKDALFVKDLCEQKGITLISRKEDAKKWSKREGYSFQEGARILRLKYLNEAAMEYNIDKIAIGHNADDNIETLLMNLIRGTGLRGLAGIDPVSGKIIRPLIGIFRKDILNFLDANGISYRIDRTNLETKYFRNKVRNILVPVIESKLRKGFKKNVKRTIEIIRGENDYLDKCAEDLLHKNCEAIRAGNKIILVEIPVEFIAELHYGLKNRIILKAIEKVRGNLVDIKLKNIEDILNISKEGGETKQVSACKDIVAVKEKSTLFLVNNLYRKDLPEKYRLLFGKISQPEQELKIRDDKKTTYKEFNLDVYTKLIDNGSNNEGFKSAKGNEAFLDYDKIDFPVRIVYWKKGDRFFPLGMEEEKKLQDFFTDLKIPKHSRGLIPVFKDKEKIIWIAGHRIDQRVRITENTSKILYIKVNKND